MYTPSKKNILIADDSIFFRIKLSSILEQAGHRVLQVKDGEELIELIKNTADDINLLVLDLQMPKVDGFAVIDWLNDNKNFARFPVIVISGTFDVETIKGKLDGKNITAVLSKDMSPDHIMFHLNETLFAKESTERDSPRVPTTIPADFQFDDRKGTSFLLSLSASGAFIHAREDFKVNEEVDLSFSIEGHDNLIEVSGVVRRLTRKEKEEEHTLFEGVGLSFTNLKEKDKKIIEEYVKKELVTIKWHRDV